jgi:hypothetical protein
MSRPRLPHLFELLLLVPLAACSSPGSDEMSPEDLRVWTSARDQAGVGALDGRRFVVDVVATGDIGGDRDTLEFAGGRFHSRGSDDYGFGSGEYATLKVEGGWRFRATCRNESGGTNEWHGIVRGDSIEGGFASIAADSATFRCNYQGHAVR